MTAPPTIGIDVGASKIMGAVVDPAGRIVDRCPRPELTPGFELVEELSRIIQILRKDCPDVGAVGVGTAGVVSWPDGQVEFAANHGHRPLNLRHELAEVCGLPVVVENDANAAAWAEASVGGRLDESLLFVAIGTGLGSGFVVDGAVVRGHRGRGAELGHLVVDRTSSEPCTCGQLGCLEVLASGRALARAGERLGRDGVTVPGLIDAARNNDPDVVSVVRAMGHILGRTIAENVMSLLPVDRVVVGGGLAVLGRQLLDPMRAACEKILAKSKYLHAPRIEAAACGPDATLIGAALLAQQRPTEQDEREEPLPVLKAAQRRAPEEPPGADRHPRLSPS